jgi:GTP-binding protein HflX
VDLTIDRGPRENLGNHGSNRGDEVGRPFGNTIGLKANQLRRLAALERRKNPTDQIIGRELARAMTELSAEIGRQIGVLLGRGGEVLSVIVGDHHSLTIPPLPRARAGLPRLAGVRLVHTHLDASPLSREDLTDLLLLKLDVMAVIETGPDGLPGRVRAAHIRPQADDGDLVDLIPAHLPGQSPLDASELIRALEEELARRRPVLRAGDDRDRAILVSVSDAPRAEIESSLKELTDLASSADIDVVGNVVQRVRKVNPRFLMGRGKLSELVIASLRLGADLIVFDRDLNPSQVRSLTEHTELRVIDRTQLILDIFARRAKSREGKLQVEMAQLKYLLPRLSTRDDSLSRLSGGIGLRGPGETRLEVDRRRVRTRLNLLASQIATVSRQRQGQRRRRTRRGLPVISIVGYTNAGKSTLLNTLTQSRVTAEDRLFATLDPSSRRLRLPRDRQVIITDTVGFIRDLPPALLTAFAATLEELHEADLLLHVLDLSHPDLERQAATVHDLLVRLGLGRIPVVAVLNKMDLVPAVRARAQARRYDGVCISAPDPGTLGPLLEVIDRRLDQLEAGPIPEVLDPGWDTIAKPDVPIW